MGDEHVLDRAPGQRGQRGRDHVAVPLRARAAALVPEAQAALRADDGFAEHGGAQRGYVQGMLAAPGTADGERLGRPAGDEETIALRLTTRGGHFMPPGLLHSQFAILEKPEPDEPAIRVDIGPPPHEVARRIVDALGLEG